MGDRTNIFLSKGIHKTNNVNRFNSLLKRNMMEDNDVDGADMDFPSDSGDYGEEDNAVIQNEENSRKQNVNDDGYQNVVSQWMFSPEELKTKVYQLASISQRGKYMTTSQRSEINQYIKELENQNPTAFPADDALLIGKWQLVYSSDDATRSSPFFWAFKNLVGNKQISQNIFSITDSIPFKDVGMAIQDLTLDTLVSEVDITIGRTTKKNGSSREGGDLVLPSLQSTMTTTSTYVPINDKTIELTVGKTQIKKSTLQALIPFLPFDDLIFPVEDVFNQLKPYSSVVRLNINYLDDDIRIRRTEDREVFVFTRL